MRRPQVVVEGSARALAPILATLEAGGWTLHSGFQLPDNEWGVVGVLCTGTVTSPSDTSLAVLAAARGAALVLAVTGPDEVKEQLVDDLHRLGPVDCWPKPASHPLARLRLDHWCLLELLAQGCTLAHARQVLHLSGRTADRYVASARTALGAKTTAEAVLLVRSAAESAWDGSTRQANYRGD